MRRTMVMACVVAVACESVFAASLQNEQLFPYTKKSGRATVEYHHDGFRVVVNYHHSQRNHNTPWLLIDMAAASRRRFTLRREHITLVTPDGRSVMLATQQAVLADSADLFSPMMGVYSRELIGYFAEDIQEPLAFFAPLSRFAHNEAFVDNNRVTLGPLFFRAPGGSWPAGTYRLVIENVTTKAALPITLD